MSTPLKRGSTSLSPSNSKTLFGKGERYNTSTENIIIGICIFLILCIIYILYKAYKRHQKLKELKRWGKNCDKNCYCEDNVCRCDFICWV